jgi:cbb3-type cytochrome oxidase maturation protein
MSVIVILILISLSLAVGFLACFVWAVNSGQYEDTLTPSMRVLTDEESRTANSRTGATSEINLKPL